MFDTLKERCLWSIIICHSYWQYLFHWARLWYCQECFLPFFSTESLDFLYLLQFKRINYFSLYNFGSFIIILKGMNTPKHFLQHHKGHTLLKENTTQTICNQSIMHQENANNTPSTGCLGLTRHLFTILTCENLINTFLDIPFLIVSSVCFKL